MKALFIGGTGTISMDISRQFLAQGNTLYLLNRGHRNAGLTGDVHEIIADINKEEDRVAEIIKDMEFDVVADFIVFTEAQAERDFRLFNGKTKQYITFSSASVYQKPMSNYLVTESTPMSNPFWPYSQAKIEVENYLNERFRKDGFPVTIIRPSHTYDDRNLPNGVEGSNGGWPILKRMLEGKPVIVHGDGTSLWTVTHARDFAPGFIGLMGNIHALGETVQITSDETVTWNQLYGILGNALGVTPKLVHVSADLIDALSKGKYSAGLLGDKSYSVVFDNSKLKRLVPGFCAKIRADQGMTETVKNILNDPKLQREEPEFDEWMDKVIDALEELKRNF